MTNLLVGLLGALVATNQPAAVSNLITQTTGLAVTIPTPDDPLEKDLQKIMDDDNAAHAEVDRWISENRAFGDKGGALPADILNARIRKRLDTVKSAYEDFLKLHPDYARAHLAFGSFLENNGDEEGGTAEYEKSRQIDPKNPASWNQLANYYGHRGSVKMAFEYYTRAIELDPTEAVYYQNFGTTVYLFRKDAREYYNIDEQQVFNKALALYDQARRYDSNNFELAEDVAETYYGIKPVRTDDALNAWTNALKLADNEVEREGVYLHLARFKLNAGRFAEAQQHINAVTNAVLNDLKQRLIKNLAKREAEAATNTPPAKVEAK